MPYANRVVASKHILPIDILIARAEARAYLFAIGEFDLAEAADPLQAYAEASGLTDELGQDAVQAILSAAFANV
jgi:hypothetical protein